MRDYVEKINKVGDNIEGVDTINSGEFNSIAKELKNTLLSAGISFGSVNPAGEDVIQNQIATAIFNISQKSSWWNDVSTQANSIILTRGDSVIYSSTPFAGQRISWVNEIENTAPPTIKIGVYNSTILKTLSGQDLPSQALLSNNLYNAVFDGAFWRLEGVNSVILTGLVYMGENQGNSLACDGAEVSRTTYARLFSKIGTKYGVGDGSSTFNLPNFTNRVPRGAGSLIADAEKQEDGIKEHLHTAITNTSIINAGNHTHPIADIRGNLSLGDSYVSLASGGFRVANYKNLRAGSNQAFDAHNDFTFSSHDAGVTATNTGGEHTHTANSITTIQNAGASENTVKALGIKFWIFI
jgi:microcystin-dependent protein